MKVAVLGCSGAMGSFFTKYFLERGYDVAGSDRVRVGRYPRGFKLASSNREAVRGADVVLVAVPIRETRKVIREVSPFVKEGSTLIEIMSVKGKGLGNLKKALATRKVALMSLHPLFGPNARSRGLKVCVIGNKRDLSATRKLFPKARLVQLNAKAHDRLMAYALSLVHILNLAFMATLAKAIGIEEFERAATPIGSGQLNLSKAILSQNPSLFSSIHVENSFVADVLSLLIAELQGMKRMIGKNDAVGLEKRFASLAGSFEKAELENALRRVYLASDS